ncbi:MAG TPA: hypothetical protein VNY07_07825 [Chthoniobacterales bacterium]|jgi:hypothetical protein|nr:hypothetical protein [Chthoniobacterales bacterium]
MNDFSELENELKKLRPAPPSPELFLRVERALADVTKENESADNVVRPERFRVNWVSLGLGLAAAAVLLIVARIEINRPAKQVPPVASLTPVPRAKPGAINNQLVPAGFTQVVYNMRDEGLHFADGLDQPMRRVRYQTHETLQWRNAATGASLRVSYPSEQVELIPVSGQ